MKSHSFKTGRTRPQQEHMLYFYHASPTPPVIFLQKHTKHETHQWLPAAAQWWDTASSDILFHNFLKGN